MRSKLYLKIVNITINGITYEKDKIPADVSYFSGASFTINYSASPEQVTSSLKSLSLTQSSESLTVKIGDDSPAGAEIVAKRGDKTLTYSLDKKTTLYFLPYYSDKAYGTGISSDNASDKLCKAVNGRVPTKDELVALHSYWGDMKNYGWNTEPDLPYRTSNTLSSGGVGDTIAVWLASGEVDEQEYNAWNAWKLRCISN